MLTIVNQASVRVPRQFLEKHWKLIVKDLRLGSHELTMVFLNPGPAKNLNRQFRGKNYATDVLSFAPIEDFGGGEVQTLGELILCPQVLQRQSREHGLTYRQELLYMMIHGVLHLIGYDHEKSVAEEKKMFQIQDRLFEKYLKK